MPLLHMPTGHPHYEGTTVDIRIRIQGEAEPTREYPCSNNGDRSRVESRPGLRYEVLLTVSNPNKKDASTTEFLEAEIEIDGRSARSVFLPHNGTYSVDTKASGDHRFPLVFDTPTVVAEGGLKDSAEAEWLGTIRVNIWLTQKGGMGEVPVRNPTKLCINELTKKAALTSATTSYGQPKKGRARAIIRIRVDPTPLLSHTFNYKTRDFLEIEGVLPPLPANQRTLHMPVPGQSVDVEEEKPMKRDEPCSSTCGVVSEHEEFELLRVKRQKRPLPSLPADSCFVDLTRLDSNALHSKFTVKMENGAEVYCLDEDDRDGKSRIKMERVIDLTWN
ncbi:hypothetical protein BC830DRAFT_1111425 [Chytriomyces sp. MP71]|nr:hypothetical protein BC830DRAFT_1111425 [Chytriomyces sp. MP71]